MRSVINLVGAALVFAACGSDPVVGPADTLDAAGDTDAPDTTTSATDTATLDTATDTATLDTTTDTTDDTTADTADTGIDTTAADTSDVQDHEVEPTPLEPLFTTGAVHQVALTLADADWQVLSRQRRSPLDMFVGDCQADPHPSPFTWFPSTVTIDGVTVANVGLRKKGWLGSIDTAKPSLKIKLDRYVDGQAIAGYDDLVLNNSKQDRSYVRQCLGYALFEAAGVPAPKCGFARVSVNGDDLGLYVLVENVDGDFLKDRFADPDGNMYEGTFSDFRTGWLGSFEPETNEDTADKRDLAAVTALLEAEPPLSDEALVTALEALVDLDGFFGFWAVESIIRHYDGYANRGNNFHVYGDPTTGRFVFVPHGIDAIMDPGLASSDPSTVAYTSAALSNRLFDIPATRARYLARLGSLLDDVWSPTTLGAELDALYELLLPHAGPDAGDASSPGSFAWSFDRIRTFVDAREGQIEAALAAGPPPSGALVDSVCWPAIGTFSATFTTTFGSFPGGPAGTGTLVVTSGGEPQVLDNVVVRAGPLGDARILVLITARTAGTTIDWRLGLELDRARFVVGTSALDWVTDFAPLFRDNDSGISVELGQVGPATFVLDAAGTTSGAEVRGTLTGTLTNTNP